MTCLVSTKGYLKSALVRQCFDNVGADVPDLLGTQQATEGRHVVSSVTYRLHDRRAIRRGDEGGTAAVSAFTAQPVTSTASILVDRAPDVEVRDRADHGRRCRVLPGSLDRFDLTVQRKQPHAVAVPRSRKQRRTASPPVQRHSPSR